MTTNQKDISLSALELTRDLLLHNGKSTIKERFTDQSLINKIDIKLAFIRECLLQDVAKYCNIFSVLSPQRFAKRIKSVLIYHSFI